MDTLYLILSLDQVKLTNNEVLASPCNYFANPVPFNQ